MSHKVDISEVIEFSNDFTTASTNLKSQLNDVEKSINQLESMSSFTGKTANEAKRYFNELHKTLLKSFENVFTQLDERLTNHLNSFERDVDSSKTTIIESGYLLETEKSMNDNYDRFIEEQETIRETLANVSDISSANHPSTFSFDGDYNSAVDVLSDLEEDLDSYTSKENENMSEIDELLHHIDAIIKDAGAISQDNQFTYFKGSTTPVNLLNLMGYNQEVHKDMVDEAKESKESAVVNMDDSSQQIAETVLNHLDNGTIDEEEYYEHLDELRKLNRNEQSDGEVSENFLKYVWDNLDETSDSFRDNSIVGIINREFENTGKRTLDRADTIKAMNANKPGAGNYMKKKGNDLLKVGRAVGGSLTAISVGFGTYHDYTTTDKTIGEAGSKNIANSAVSAATSYGAASIATTIAVVAGSATPVGWAVVAGIGAAAVTSSVFNYAYDNNVLGLEDKLDWAGQKMDDAGYALRGVIDDTYDTVSEGIHTARENVSDGMDRAGEAVSGFVDSASETVSETIDGAGEAVSGFVDSINPFS